MTIFLEKLFLFWDDTKAGPMLNTKTNLLFMLILYLNLIWIIKQKTQKKLCLIIDHISFVYS